MDMADARSREAWAHTAQVLCLIANVNRDPKKQRPFKPADFDPHTQARRRSRPVTVARLTDEMVRIAEQRQGRG